MEINFFISCEPPRTTYQAGQQILRTRQGRWFIGKSAKGKHTANWLRSIVRPFRPKKPLDGIIQCEIDWIFPYKKTEKKKNKELLSMPCITKPDCDNIAKGLLDAMQQANFFVDDSRIYDLHIKKIYSSDCGIRVRLKQISLSHYLQNYNESKVI
jgi:Holliday junction resolvase RusA-like endonuclease